MPSTLTAAVTPRQIQAFNRLSSQLLAVANQALPGLKLRVIFVLGDAKEFPKKRNYAYSAWDGQQATIAFAPKVLSASKDRQTALLMHELSHAVLQHLGIDHSERECDATAEEIFGCQIYYDLDDVQTLKSRGTKRPRPEYLPK